MNESEPATAAADTSEPLLRVVRGVPTETELAAVVVAVRSRLARAPVNSADSAGGGAPRPSNWAAYWRSVHQPVRTGLDPWRASVHPALGTGW